MAKVWEEQKSTGVGGEAHMVKQRTAWRTWSKKVKQARAFTKSDCLIEKGKRFGSGGGGGRTQPI